MSEVSRHAPGSFCWVELATTDIESAGRFYVELFGWEISDVPIGDGAMYAIARIGGKDVGGLYELTAEQQSQGVAPHWLSYVAVRSVNEAVGRVPALGGTVLRAPFDVMDQGRMAVVQDPSQATLALWEAKAHGGIGIVDEPGATCWNELYSSDPVAACRFYGALLGWTTRAQDMETIRYTVFMSGSADAAGMMPITPEWGAVPPDWLVYFAVDDCDAQAAVAQDLGGTVRVEPTDLTDVGRFAVLQDAQGGVFAILQAAMAA